MSMDRLYNDIAQFYSRVDYFKIISSALSTALEQLQTKPSFLTPSIDILDLGSGDGRMLELIASLNPKASLFAVDVSGDMLALVKQRVPHVTIQQASIDETQKIFPEKKFDFIIASFVCAYVGLKTLLQQSEYLLKNNGYFIFLTTTRQAFPNFQGQLKQLSNTSNVIDRLIYHWIQKTLEKTLVPSDFLEIENQSTQNGFSILERRQLITEIVFNTAQEAYDFGRKGGWALSLLDYPWLPNLLMHNGANRILQHLKYPLHDKIIVEVVTLQKQKSS